MVKFFSYILKQKKTAIFVLLFIALAGVFTPKIASAFCSDVWGCLTRAASFISAPTALLDNAPVLQASIGWVFVIPILAFLLIESVTFFVASLVALLLKLILLITASVSYTSLNPAFNLAVSMGWPIIRNFANIFIVLGFIVIAVATILRFKEYAAKRLLAKLIIAALLVNFSLVICGVIIDASNIVMNFFLGNTTSSMGAVFSESGLAKQFSNNFIMNLFNTIRVWDVGTMELMFRIVSSIFYDIMAIVVYGLYAFLFLFRIMALWILVILSPLAFVCYVFPATKSMVFDKWRDNFVKWCFVGVTGAFFLMIGMRLMIAMNAAGGSLITAELLTNNYPPGWSALGPIVTRSITRFFGFFIPGIFLIIGFLFSLQMSTKGSSMAIDAFKGSGKLLKASGKIAADKFGLTKKMQEAGDVVTKSFEGTLLPKGYTQAQRDRRLQPSREAEAAAAAQTAEQRRQSIMAGPGMGLKSQEEFMANFERARENGELSNMDPAELKKAQDAYVAATGKTSAYSITPETARQDTDRANELREKYKQDTAAGETDLDYAFRIDDMLKKESYDNMDTKKIDKMTDTELNRLSKEVDSAGQSTSRAAKATEKLIKDGKKHLIRGGTAAEIETAIDDAQLHGASTSLYSKASPDLAHKDADKIRELGIKNPGKTPAKIENMAHAEAFARMPVDKELLKLSDSEKISRIIASAGNIDPGNGKLRGEVSAEMAQVMEDMAEKGTLGKLAKELERLATAVGHTVDGIEEAAKQMDYMDETLGSTVYKDANKKDLRFVEHDKKAIAERAQEVADRRTGVAGTPVTATDRTEATTQLVDKAHGDLSVYQIAESLPEEAITLDFIKNKKITAEKLGKVYVHEKTSDTKKSNIKAAASQLRLDAMDAYNDALIADAAGNIPERDRLIDLSDDWADKAAEIDAMT